MVEYTDTARTQLRKLDRQAAGCIVDYMGKRCAIDALADRYVSWEGSGPESQTETQRMSHPTH